MLTFCFCFLLGYVSHYVLTVCTYRRYLKANRLFFFFLEDFDSSGICALDFCLVNLLLKQCLYKLHNGRIFSPARFAHRLSTKRFGSPSAWVADTLSARCASTSSTVRHVPLTRPLSTQTLTSCL